MQSAKPIHRQLTYYLKEEFGFDREVVSAERED